MKTTLELPDDLFRAATLAAAADGRSLIDLVTEALRDKIGKGKGNAKDAGTPAWMELFGTFGGSTMAREETKQIQQRIDAEFGLTDPLE